MFMYSGLDLSVFPKITLKPWIACIFMHVFSPCLLVKPARWVSYSMCSMFIHIVTDQWLAINLWSILSRRSNESIYIYNSFQFDLPSSPWEQINYIWCVRNQSKNRTYKQIHVSTCRFQVPILKNLDYQYMFIVMMISHSQIRCYSH